MLDWRPNANTIPSGSDNDTQTVPKIRLSIKPPMSRDGTAGNATKFSPRSIRYPPRIQHINAAAHPPIKAITKPWYSNLRKDNRATRKPAKATIEVRIVPPQTSQNAKNGYIKVKKNNFLETVRNNTGAMAIHSKIAARFGRQNSEAG